MVGSEDFEYKSIGFTATYCTVHIPVQSAVYNFGIFYSASIYVIL
jgi:hypothetical protein